jgi:DNA-binding beta-propeller fold protein YncE
MSKEETASRKRDRDPKDEASQKEPLAKIAVGGGGGKDGRGSAGWGPGELGSADLVLVQKRLHNLLEIALEGKQTDACFQLDSGEEVRGHRWVMSMGSTYLSMCFNSGMREALTGVVKVPEVSKSTFVALMSFLYVGDVSKERRRGVDAGQLLHLEELWGVEGLREWVVGSLDGGSVFRALQHGMDTKDHDLVSACMETASKIKPSLVSVEGLRRVSVAACLDVLVKRRSGGMGRVLFANKWWEANSGWATSEELCRELVRGVDVKQMTDAELRTLLSKPWLFEEGIIQGVLTGREVGCGWAQNSNFSEDPSFQAQQGCASPDEVVVQSAGVCVFEDGGICVADQGTVPATVVVTDAGGKFLLRFHLFAVEMGSLEPVAEPVAEALEGLCICVRPGTNTIYVTDRKKNRGVWLYDRNGNFIRHCSFLGSKGSIQGIAVTRAGELIISVLGGFQLEHSVRLFDDNLEFIRGWFADTSKDSKEKITGVAVSPKDGSVILNLAKSTGARVVVLRTDVDDDDIGYFNFRVVRTFGQGILTGPYSMCVSDKGEFVVADLAHPTSLDDPGRKRVCIFSSEGQLLQEIEVTQGWGSSPVAVRADGKIVIAHSRKSIQLLQVADQA